jgi:LAO/AO transport system kinase
LESSGQLVRQRSEQTRRWMWQMVEERALRALHNHPEVAARTPEIERAIQDGTMTATLGAEALLQAFGLPPS